MLNNQLNLNHLRIFESVYRTRSMTMAAKELHLTQSGVSQHMKSFESDLGISLFNRINQRLVPTQQASELYENCKNTFDALDRTVTQLKAQKKQISGRVVLGVPEEFANNVVVPLLSSFLSEHSEVKVGIKVGIR